MLTTLCDDKWQTACNERCSGRERGDKSLGQMRRQRYRTCVGGGNGLIANNNKKESPLWRFEHDKCAKSGRRWHSVERPRYKWPQAACHDTTRRIRCQVRTYDAISAISVPFENVIKIAKREKAFGASIKGVRDKVDCFGKGQGIQLKLSANLPSLFLSFVTSFSLHHNVCKPYLHGRDIFSSGTSVELNPCILASKMSQIYEKERD